jgi:4,5-dihydroxyphthalate decarboxylase
MALKLTIAFSDNPRIQPLRDGTIRPENIDLEVVTFHDAASMLFYRNLRYGLDSDVSEMSVSETLLAKDRNEALGRGRWDWTSIPVFMSRGHFWTDFYVNTSSGIKDFGDLRGKRIGVPDYAMTAALWLRVTLKELYGIEAWDNVWYNCRSKELSQGGMLGLYLEGYGVVNGVILHWLTVDQTMDVMLDRGELDASFLPKAWILSPANMKEAITAGDPTVLDRYGGTSLTDNPRIRRLLDGDGKEIISACFRKTGCHHANHHVVVKNSILREHPWVAMELYKAFERSKEVAYERARRAQSAYLYFEGNDWKEQAVVFGEDPYPSGLRAMRKTVERAIQGSLEQGLIRKPIKVEDLYFHTTLNT